MIKITYYDKDTNKNISTLTQRIVIKNNYIYFSAGKKPYCVDLNYLKKVESVNN